MCVIIKVEPKKTLPKELLKNCYDNNPDGYGMMIAEDEGLYYHKDVKNFDDFWTMWRSFDREKPRAIHFRRKTHGLLNQENCHPFFPEGGEFGFMHNGVINVPEVYKNMNDTYNFMMQKIIPFVKRYPDIIEEDFFYKMLEEQTTSSKLLFLTRAGNYHITNTSMWHTAHGCMFSNKHSLDRREPVKPYSHSSSTHRSTANSNLPVENNGRNYSHERNDHDWEDEMWGYGDSMFPFDDSRPYGMGHNSKEEPVVGPVTSPYKGNIDRWEEMLKNAQEQLDKDDQLDPSTQAALREAETAIAQIMTRNKGLIIEGECTVVNDTGCDDLLPSSMLPVVAEGSFEAAGAMMVSRIQDGDTKGLPEVDSIGEVEETDEDHQFDIFKTPEDLKAMSDDEIEDWAEECPFGAAQAIMMLTGRV